MTVQDLVLTRHFNAPPERVFAAFTQQGLMQSWFGPGIDDCPPLRRRRPGRGKYRVEMHSPAGGVHVLTGEFREIVEPQRLVFSWGWLRGAGRVSETLVTLTFKASQGGTDLTLVQTGFLDEAVNSSHGAGWISSWNSLDALLAGKAKARTPGPEVIGDGRSTYTRSVRIAFFEKGVAHGLKAAPPHSPDVVARNPFGKIPVLRLGEESLFEASAILRYIDEVYPGPSLMPAEPLARAKAEQWISAFNAYFDRPIVRDYVSQYFFPRGADGKPDRATIEAALPAIRKALASLDAAYGQRSYLVGDAPSLPDILLAPAIHYLGAFPEGRELIAEHPNVKRAHEVFAQRPSFVAATKAAA